MQDCCHGDADEAENKVLKHLENAADAENNLLHIQDV